MWPLINFALAFGFCGINLLLGIIYLFEPDTQVNVPIMMKIILMDGIVFLYYIVMSFIKR